MLCFRSYTCQNFYCQISVLNWSNKNTLIYSGQHDKTYQIISDANEISWLVAFITQLIMKWETHLAWYIILKTIDHMLDHHITQINVNCETMCKKALASSMQPFCGHRLWISKHWSFPAILVKCNLFDTRDFISFMLSELVATQRLHSTNRNY